MNDAEPVDTAVCCSGGGMRSATYCLGALQTLAADDAISTVDLVTAVSGGSYIAAAWALAAGAAAGPAGPQPGGAQPAGPPAAQETGYRSAYRNAFRPGSAQESQLRDHTHYLVPDAAQGLRGLMSLIWGAVGNLLLVTSVSYVLLGLDGLLLRAIGGVRWSVTGGSFEPHLAITPAQVWIPAALGIAAAALFALSRSPRGQRPVPGSDGTIGDELAFWIAALLGAGALAAVLLIGGPALFTACFDVHWIATGMGSQPSVASTAAALSIYTVGLVTLAKAAAGNVSVYWSRLGSTGEGVLRPWLARAGQVVLPWLGSAFIVAGLLAWGVYILGIATRPGFPRWHLAAAAVLFCVLHVAIDANRTSMHDFYRDRLVSGYLVPGTQGALLSGLAGVSPALTVCAAANLSAGTIRAVRPGSSLQRGVPPGRGAVSWIFTPTATGVHFPNEQGGAELAPTRAYETLMGAGRMTLFDIVADSGAAGSPLTGRATSAARQLLLAAVNVRLGAWLPRPALVRLVSERAEAGDAGTGRAAWSQVLAETGQHGRLARWWLSCQLTSWEKVYRHHLANDRGQATDSGHLAAALRWRIWQPNLFLLWREAAGRHPVGRKWIYVTDGGHYDNLGLVEALRRSARRIYVIDAGGDPGHSYRALGQAVALARSELGVEISIDPGQMELWPGQAVTADPAGAGGGVGRRSGGAIPGPRPPQVRQPYATGTYRYSTGPRAGQQGVISVVKLGVWAGQDLPWDVRAYYEAHPTFPRSSTLQQLYDDEDFEAYRELGAASMRALLASRRRRARKNSVAAVPEPAPPR